MTRRALPVALVALLLVACTPTATIASLDNVVGAVSAALPILQIAGVQPAVIMLAQGYLQSVSVAVHETTLELAGTDTGPVKASKIAAYFAAAVVPNLPPGTNPLVAQLLTGVTQAVQAFVSHFAGGPGFAAQVTPQIKMTRSDRQAVAKIAAKNQANLKALLPAKP